MISEVFFQPDKEKEYIKPESILNNSFEIIGKSLENNNITIIKNYDSKLALYLYNHEMLQVFLNILKNAQEALIENRQSDREIDITIKEDENFVHTIICDNSGGINKNILDKIFEPYFSTKDKKNGTGLGLYMSKIIIEKHHNSEISAFNAVHKSCFKISLKKSEQEPPMVKKDWKNLIHKHLILYLLTLKCPRCMVISCYLKSLRKLQKPSKPFSQRF